MKSTNLSLLFLLIFSINKLLAIPYFVDGINGLDINTGLTFSQAKRTIQAAANLTAPGDTVFVGNGTYTTNGSSVVNIPVSGTADAWIVYIAYPGHLPKVKSGPNTWNAINCSKNYIKIIGFEVEGYTANITLAAALNQPSGCLNTSGTVEAKYNGNGITLDGRINSVHNHHNEVSKCIVHDCCGGGIAVLQTDYVTIEDNLVYNTSWYTKYGASGISLLSTFPIDAFTGYKNFVRRNKCFGNRLFVPWKGPCKITDGNGIIIDSNDDFNYTGRTLVENNVCWFNGGSGIHSFASYHVDIFNNTAYRNSQSKEINGGEIYPNKSIDVKIYNNISVSDSANCINTNYNNTNIEYFNNLHYNITPPHTITASLTNASCITGLNPLFISPDSSISADFHLQAASPAINKGHTSIFSATDFEGNARPQGALPDMGAYERLITGVLKKKESPIALNLYPNPTQDHLFVESHFPGSAIIFVSVTNAIGKQEAQYEKQLGTFTLPTNSLPTGIHFLKLQQGPNQIVKPFWVNR